MNCEVSFQGGKAFDIRTRGHHIVCDQPVANGGTDRGMTPPEFLLASLGACGAYYAVEYMKTRGLDPAGLRVEVDAEKATQPARLGRFRIQVFPGIPLDGRHSEGLVRAVKACSIHNTLVEVPAIEIQLRQEMPAGSSSSH